MSANTETAVEEEGEEAKGKMLQQAAIYNNVDFMTSLLQGDEQKHVDAQDSYGRTALFTAVSNNSLECGHMLLQAGADPNVLSGPECDCMGALHVAALKNKQQFVSMLLQFGADINLEDSGGNNALTLAERHQSEECRILLQAYKEDGDRQIKKNQEELLSACLQCDLLSATELASRLSPSQVAAALNTLAPHPGTSGGAGGFGSGGTSGSGSSTLHRAAERDDTELAEFLLSRGASVHVHPVTGFSPLHSACAAGATRCARILLENFPELVQSPTIDGTLPLHIAVSGNNLELVRLILDFPYPEVVRKIFKEGQGNRMYRLGFNINAKDGHGRTPLHLAALSNQPEIVSALVKYTVQVSCMYNEGHMEADVPTIPGDGEDGLERQDTLTEDSEEISASPSVVVEEFHPVMSEIDLIDLDGNTPLHLAVKGENGVGFHKVAKVLLQHKANPTKPIITPSGNSTPLMEACMNEDTQMVDLLLKFEATDEDSAVLQRAIESLNEDLAGVFLKHRSHYDSENSVNRLALIDLLAKNSGKKPDAGQLKSIWPSSSVGVNWHGLRLPYVAKSWLEEACYMKNGYPAHAVSSELCLAAITRIDLSNNNLTQLPCEIFLLPSLHSLNASNNLIKWIPGCEILVPRSCSCFGSRFRSLAGNGNNATTPDTPDTEDGLECIHRQASQQSVEETDALWDCPCLDAIDLDNNKLRSLPKAVFRLPKLRRLTAQHNELETLPFEMWTSPALTELHLAHNNLRELSSISDSGQISRCSSAMSALEQLDSISVTAMNNQNSPSTQTDAASRSQPTTPRHKPHKPSTTDEDRIFAAQNPDPFFLVGPNQINGLKGQHEEIPVNVVSYWQGKIKIKANVVDTSSNGDKISKLHELNLSHNQFERVPEGLSCLAPSLTRLNLSHNRLRQIGTLESYPAGVRWLDLSWNEITDTSSPGIIMDGGRYCYSPHMQHRHRLSMSRPSTPLMVSRNRTNSSASLPSVSSLASSAPSSCPHRGHAQLARLKTLKLGNNRLTKVALSLSPVDEHGSGEMSSTESLHMAASMGQEPGNKGGGSSSNSPEHKAASLLYPNVAVLDLSNNNLHSISPDIKDLLQLSELKINNNKPLKELPTEMGLLKKLWNLDFSGCTVEKSLNLMLGDKVRKTAAVLGYLKSVKEEAKLYNRMKLMFVGVQGIGKTSLLNQMRKEGKTNANPRHWAQRMGHTGIKDKDLKGENISTVGVDISDLVLQRGNKEVILRTWDFGGQREYYATHQYFLSKRSLYLVVWKVTDGEKGVEQILQWLVNIQARAPNSPVIIVGTHLDLVTRKKYPANYVPDLQRLILSKYMSHQEPDKCGLPRVVGRIEISCKSRLMFNNHVTDLVQMILNVCFEENVPGSKGIRLLEQKVPASYVHLQDIVGLLARERMLGGKDPVLHAEQYKVLVMAKMSEMYGTSFRDLAELNQATQFLHENGVVLHYDDVNLADIYFLDPQWLCDVLANVVTIREINSLAKCGIMRTDDLKILFKNAAFKPEDIKTYIIDLLNKFEVALMWDSSNLLIPSLLPTEEDINRKRPFSDIRIPVKGVGSGRSRPRIVGEPIIIDSSKDLIIDSSNNDPDTFPQPPDPFSQDPNTTSTSTPREIDVTPDIAANPNPAASLVRLYLMSYFPSGFWPRLITRLLADDTFHSIALCLYELPDVLVSSESFTASEISSPEWKCWQSGVELKYLGITLLRLKEAPWENPKTLCDYRACSLVVRTDDDTVWNPLSMDSTSILELYIPNESITVQFDPNSESIVVQPLAQVVASLLTKIVDHVDTLLEDWYPDLGDRFIQNSKGMYLITRIVPCSRCLLYQIEEQQRMLENPEEAWSMVELNQGGRDAKVTEPIIIGTEKSDPVVAGSMDDPDCVIPTSQDLLSESAPTRIVGALMSGPVAMVEKVASNVIPNWPRSPDHAPSSSSSSSSSSSTLIHCYLIEQCLQSAQENRIVFCPIHANLGPFFIASMDGHIQAGHVAPDSVFQDIGDQYLVDQDLISRGRFLGKGAFGAVYAGTMIQGDDTVAIAMKMMQPVKPGSDASASIQHQYQAEKKRWVGEPLKHACRAYLNARKELGILLSLQHKHIVALVGLSVHPLCLLLELAPQGALTSTLAKYHRVGARLPAYAIRHTVMQVASALEYLHAAQIIYRDLKSENVLVWAFPPPHGSGAQGLGAGQEAESLRVHVKLADYGVSRSVLPSGTRGLAGTPPFIAPEIIQHNGEETYTEKVDCFSFGMFLYELFVLKIPFEGEGSTGGGAGANLKSHVMQGGRPPLTPRDLWVPTHLLDLMCLCWAHDPADRPSAAEICRLAACPELAHLQQCAALPDTGSVTAAASAPHVAGGEEDDLMAELPFLSAGAPTSDVWLAVRSQDKKKGEMLIYSYKEQHCVQAQRIQLGTVTVTYMCMTDTHMWCGDNAAHVHVYSLSDYCEVVSFKASSRAEVTIQCITYSRPENQVYIIVSGGRWIVCEARIPDTPPQGYSPVKTECLGNNKEIFCMMALNKTPTVVELWCGQGGGRLAIWDGSTGGRHTLLHGDKDTQLGDVMFLTTDHSGALWTYLYPGSVIYRWDVGSRTITSTLDIATVIPQGIALSAKAVENNRLKSGKCQVRSLAVCEDYLFAGTTWGCLVVIDKLSMLPVSAVHCHADDSPYVKAVLPLVRVRPGGQPAPDSSDSSPEKSSSSSRPSSSLSTSSSTLLEKSVVTNPLQSLPTIVTIGKGHRDVIGKCIPRHELRWDSNPKSTNYILSWEARYWKQSGQMKFVNH